MSLNKILPYKSKIHARIIEALKSRVDLAKNKLSDYHNRMESDEMLYFAYMRKKDMKEASCREPSDKVDGSQTYREIYVPYSYAILMTMHTYFASVFLGRSPVFQYTGRHGESQNKVQVLEALVDYQVQAGEALPVLFNWLLDPPKRGFGVVGVYWEEKYSNMTEIIEREKSFMGIPVPGTKEKIKRSTRKRVYAGNKLYNIRPQDFIFDPRVSLLQFQAGEFAGRYVEVGWNTIVNGEAAGRFYNVDEIRDKLKANNSSYASIADSAGDVRDQGSPLVQLPDLQGPSAAPNIKNVDFGGFYELIVELIPKDWGLGESKLPEKWQFTFSYKHNVIIESRPLGYWHDKYPYSVLPYEFDAYSVSPRSMLEVAKPLNDVMTWLINSHFYSVRKMLNDQLIFDPSKVQMVDMLDTQAGRMIRLKPEAYGTDPRLAVHQLNTHDSTQTHFNDMKVIAEMLQRVTGVAENIMGMVNPGGRKTATEVRTSSSFGVNRLKTVVEYMSASGFNPLSQMMVQNTQQYYDEEQEFRIAGDLMSGNTPRTIRATPEDIQGFFDFVPVDGTMPIDRFAQVQMWIQLMEMMGASEQLMAQYDQAGIFSWVAKLAGLKNIDQFKIQVVPDNSLQNLIQQNNLQPITGEQYGGTTTDGGGTRSGTPENATGVPGAGQAPGLGPTG